jgi:large subunit ribosomal protein L30
MSKVKVTLVKGKSGSTQRQINTLIALGLGRRTSSVEVEVTPAIKGMINKVNHLVKIENL